MATSKCFGGQNDACKKLVHGKKFKDSIALIHEGGCDPLIKVMHARDAGARAVVFYTNAKNVTTDIEVLNNAVLPVTFINHEDGYRAFKSDEAEFTNTLLAMPAPPSDLNGISSFSSLGPTNELDLKPELMAVGGNVFSTLPRYLKSYGFRSGTSFSTPYIAGSVALLLSNTQKDLKPDQAKNMLMNFATQGNKKEMKEKGTRNDLFIKKRFFVNFSERTHPRCAVWRFPFTARSWCDRCYTGHWWVFEIPSVTCQTQFQRYKQFQ